MSLQVADGWIHLDIGLQAALLEPLGIGMHGRLGRMIFQWSAGRAGQGGEKDSWEENRELI